jgi:hypothetical protein
MNFSKLAVLAAMTFLLAGWAGTAQAAGERVEENNFPIWRCANSNNWAHYSRGSSVRLARCTTFRNAQGRSFKIEIHYQDNFRDYRGKSYANFKFCSGRNCQFRVPASNLISSGRVGCTGCHHIDRGQAKNIVLYILRNRGRYWRSRRSDVFKKHGVRRGQTKDVYRGVSIEKGYDRPGKAYARYNISGARNCRVKCARDRRCKAFTHASNSCFLKSHPFNRMRSPTVTSGKRVR